ESTPFRDNRAVWLGGAPLPHRRGDAAGGEPGRGASTLWDLGDPAVAIAAVFARPVPDHRQRWPVRLDSKCTWARHIAKRRILRLPQSAARSRPTAISVDPSAFQEIRLCSRLLGCSISDF